jgi:hypothetical protein
MTTTTIKKPHRSETIANKTLGFRNVLNTPWPREAYLSREYRHHKIDCYSVEVICNGIHDSRKEFRTRREAEAAFAALGEGI